MSTYVSLEVRRAHRPRHAVLLRRSPLRALKSILREAGDSLWGAFVRTVD